MSEPSSVPPTRRGFLGAITVLLGGAIAALAAVPVLGSILSPLRPAPRTGNDVPIPVGNVSDFTVGVPRRVELVRSVTDAWSRSEATTVGAAWLTRKADGTFTALSTICPHLGCGVNMDKQRGHFACPCHTSAFAMDGARLEGPAPRGMDPLTVEVRGQAVLVHYRRFKQGISEREEV
ncbi:ubiquinol-cytochrome c reductase iron-sulfur subunit [Hyalangium rubrum]|uniref:Rieske (2Fe-2S) protein n=1 Tax=Hyalangium rubrum TaxID=3103134 RepID=A0ABU5H0U4_9BACT|nr:Rieske (2Fe-2S) protein [Hyalangium sp. s54d21]MDY7227072.1 Rieske (2Fe-2S) protein [Hyalangium sp. s54d21]